MLSQDCQAVVGSASAASAASAAAHNSADGGDRKNHGDTAYCAADVPMELAKRTAGYLPGDLKRLCWTAKAIRAAKLLVAVPSTAGASTFASAPASECSEGNNGRGSRCSTVAGASAATAAAASVVQQLDWATCWLPALAETKPSVPGPFETGIEPVSWSDVAGVAKARARLTRLLQSIVEGPTVEGVDPAAGVLLHGPSGCGKTLLASAALSNCTLNVIRVAATELFGKYVGESEEQIRMLFAAARRCKPCVVFLDELDAVALKRGSRQAGTTGVEERVLSQLLNEIDGIQDSRGIFVLGCTNQPLTELDDAILRPGRFEVHLHLEHPSERDRQEIAALWCGRVFRSGSAGSGPPGAASEVAGARAELERWVAAETEGASGAEIGWLFQQAAIELASGGHGGDGRIHDAAFEEALRSATARLKPRLAARVSRDA